MDLALTRSILEAAVAARAFPGAAVEVGRADGPLWSAAFGALGYEPGAPSTSLDTVFDLASLTKVVATTSFAMQLVEAGRLELDGALDTYLTDWSHSPSAGVRVRQLLDHSSGLPAHVRLWEAGRGRRDYEDVIRGLPLEFEPGGRSVYSDVGFILLGFILENLAGRSLDAQMRDLNQSLALGDLQYLPPSHWAGRIAPTEFDSWRNRLLVGEVHDENAAGLGGVASHAGLFGTAPAVGRFARAVLAALDEAVPALPRMRQFATPTGVPGSSRALGWDTMRPSSSCGVKLSPRSIGHVGFTGTSLWIDPDQNVYVVLLTNRVHPTRSNAALGAVRPKFHDAVIEDLGRLGLLGDG